MEEARERIPPCVPCAICECFRSFDLAGPIPQVRPTQPVRPNVRRLKPNGAPEWDVEQSSDLFQIRGWGAPYFSINEKGHVDVRPDPDTEKSIDLFDLAQDLQARGIELPIL